MPIAATGEVGIGAGAATPTVLLHVNGDRIRLEPWQTSAPGSLNEGGIALVKDGTDYYIYVRTDQAWRRALLSTI